MLYQVPVAVALSGLGLFLWVRLTPPADVRHRDAVESRLCEATLSQHGLFSTFSTFVHESKDVSVEEWADRDSTEVVFRGRMWRANLGPGCKARVGLYRVEQIKSGRLILTDITD